MLPSSQDKKMLIQSMKKLTHHISNNSIRQKQIFDSLTRNDLLKIISNLSDDNQYLRRISGLLLAELFYNNDELKENATKLLAIYPPEGRVTFILTEDMPQSNTISNTKVSFYVQKVYLTDEITSQIIIIEQVLLGYQFGSKNLADLVLRLQEILVIYIFRSTSKERRQQMRKEKRNQKSKQKSVKSIDSRGSSSKRQSIGINSSFYKNYLQARNRKAQSPTSYRDYYEKRDFNRPNTSRNHKNDYMASNYKNQGNTIQSISQYAKNSKESSSYDKNVGTPVKKQRQNRIEINSFHQSIDLGSTSLRSPIGSAHRQSMTGYRAPQTDRKHDTANRFKINDPDSFNSSTAEKLKYPQTTKNSSYINQHEKFYKRVKQILKK